MTMEDYKAAGWVDENGNQNTDIEFKSQPQGTATHLVAAFAPSADLFPAGAPAPFLSDGQVRLEDLAEKATGVEQEEKLWKLSEELVGRTFA